MIGVDLGGKLNRGASGDVLIAVDGADAVLSLISARGGRRELQELRRMTGTAVGVSSWWYSHALVMRYDELPEDFLGRQRVEDRVFQTNIYNETE